MPYWRDISATFVSTHGYFQFASPAATLAARSLLGRYVKPKPNHVGWSESIWLRVPCTSPCDQAHDLSPVLCGHNLTGAVHTAIGSVFIAIIIVRWSCGSIIVSRSLITMPSTPVPS